MAEVYPAPKLMSIRTDNPNYWALLVSRSEYTEGEINQAIAEADTINIRLQALYEKAYDLFDGMTAINIQNSDLHRKLHEMLAKIDYTRPDYSENHHLNRFPVRKWQTDIARLGRQIDKIEKFMAKNF